MPQECERRNRLQELLDPEDVSVVCGGGALQLPDSSACLVPLAATLCVRGRELVRKVGKY